MESIVCTGVEYESSFTWARRYVAERQWRVYVAWWPEEGRCACGNPECDSIGKHPIFPCCPHGFKSATSDLSVVFDWLRRYPKANLGIATGLISNVFVVDVDTYKEGCTDYHDETTLRQRSGGGGDHYFYTCDIALSSKNIYESGIDRKADGGGIIVANSRHVRGGSYDWYDYSASMRPLPERFRKQTSIVYPRHDAIIVNRDIEQRRRRAVKFLEKHPPSITKKFGGPGGGHDLTFLAAMFVAHGLSLGEQEAFNLLRLHYNPRCRPEWSDKELRHKCSEAMKSRLPPGYALGEPAAISREALREDPWVKRQVEAGNIDELSKFGKDNGCTREMKAAITELKNDQVKAAATGAAASGRRHPLESVRSPCLAKIWIEERGEFRNTVLGCHAYNKATGAWEHLDEKDIERSLMRRFHLIDYFSTNRKGEVEIKQYDANVRNVAAIRGAIELTDTCYDPSFFSDSPPGITFANGWLDGQTFQLTSHHPDQRSRFVLSYNYDPKADTKFFEEYICEVVPDQSDLMVLQEFLGACVLGVAPQYQKMLIILGKEGGNGKSTLLDVLVSALFPKDLYARSRPEKWDRDDYMKAMVERGQRLNLMGELSKGSLKHDARFKEAITDKEFEGRDLYGKPVMLQNHLGHIATTNDYPTLHKMDSAMQRRIVVIGVGKSFTSDGTAKIASIIEDNAKGFYPAIMNWALAGLMRLRSNNGIYTETTSHKERWIEWNLQMNPVASFFKGCCVIDDGRPLRECPSGTTIHRSFLKYMERCGDKNVVPPQEMMRRFALIDDVRVSGLVDGRKRYNVMILPPRHWNITGD